MNATALQLNLAMAWLWILAGFVSGMILGLKFHNENWLGGYSSYPRRMYRLGHISFFGLGLVNFLFYFTAKALPGAALLTFASWAFVIGALTMPLCCALMAQSSRFQFLFGIPVTALITGAAITLLEVIKP